MKFHFLKGPFHFSNRVNAKKFLVNLFEKNGKRIEAINYIFCTDEYLLVINEGYLKHNTYTDIITFELSGKEEPLISDIYISIDRIRENAKNFKNSFNKELHRVIFHGALHLCGFKDKSTADTAIMKTKEDFCISEYFVSRGIAIKDNTISHHL